MTIADTATRRLTVRYFAAVREGIGRGEETVDVPKSIISVGDLLGWLRTRGADYAAAIGNDRAVRAAVDRVHAKDDTLLGDAREVALFPMMTGG